MTGKDLREMVKKGINPIVEFNKYVEELETRLDEGMRAYITKVSQPDNSDCVEITFEEKDFTDYNKSIERPDWLNPKTNKYDLKFGETIQAKSYKGLVTFYEMENEEVCNFRVIEDDSLKLFHEYKNNNNDIPYIKWLENTILELRKS